METEFDAVVEPAPERPLPDSHQVAALDHRFGEVAAFLPKGRLNVLSLKYQTAKAAFVAAREGGDTAKAVNDWEEMLEIVAGMSEVEGPLQPPKAFLEGLAIACRELHRHLQTAAPLAGVPYDALEMARTIDTQSGEADRAFARADQQAYSEALDMLQNLRDHLGELAEKVRPVSSAPPPDPRAEARALIEKLRDVADELRNLASGKRPDLVDAIEREDDALIRLSGEVDSDPQGAYKGAQERAVELGKIRNALSVKKDGTPPTPYEA